MRFAIRQLTRRFSVPIPPSRTRGLATAIAIEAAFTIALCLTALAVSTVAELLFA